MAKPEPKKVDDWFPLRIGKYLGDTCHLTRDQHGAYFLLLMAYWRRQGPLPADDAQLAAICKATPAEWKKLKPVISGFFHEQGGMWVQKRSEEEIALAKKMSEAKASAGKKGGHSRWQKDSTAIAEPLVDAKQNDTPISLPSPSSASAEHGAADNSTLSEIGRLNCILSFDESDWKSHAANIRALVDLKAEGCDFEKHIRPAAEKCAGKAKRIAYIAPAARELRDSEKAVAALGTSPKPFEDTDLAGWKERLRVLSERGSWLEKWGAKPGEPNCRVPKQLLELAA